MRRHWFPKPYADEVARFRVTAGFAMVAAFAWFSHPGPKSLAFGLPLSACGLALRAWAAGHLAKDQRLATSGPYSFTRNPLYLGTLMAALGLAVAAHRIGLGVLVLLMFGLIYLPAIELEEQHLTAILPGYAEFAARVPLLIPRWPRQFGPDRFSFSLYRKNREYQALLAWSIGAAWLVARALWIP
jgi:protein-S-isoprenylcysteine O-methyltransferase Ste14